MFIKKGEQGRLGRKTVIAAGFPAKGKGVRKEANIDLILADCRWNCQAGRSPVKLRLRSWFGCCCSKKEGVRPRLCGSIDPRRISRSCVGVEGSREELEGYGGA